MAFSAAFTIGGIATYWIMNYHRTGFDIDRAGVVWLTLGVLTFVVSCVVVLTSRRGFETSNTAIERQMLEHRQPQGNDHEHAH